MRLHIGRSLWEESNASKMKRHFLSSRLPCVCAKRLTDEKKPLCSISLNPALSPDYVLISASILLLLLLLVKRS